MQWRLPALRRTSQSRNLQSMKPLKQCHCQIEIAPISLKTESFHSVDAHGFQSSNQSYRRCIVKKLLLIVASVAVVLFASCASAPPAPVASVLCQYRIREKLWNRRACRRREMAQGNDGVGLHGGLIAEPAGADDRDRVLGLLCSLHEQDR